MSMLGKLWETLPRNCVIFSFNYIVMWSVKIAFVTKFSRKSVFSLFCSWFTTVSYMKCSYIFAVPRRYWMYSFSCELSSAMWRRQDSPRRGKYLVLVYTKTVDSVERVLRLASQTENILCYLPPSSSRTNGLAVCIRDKCRNHRCYFLWWLFSQCFSI